MNVESITSFSVALNLPPNRSVLVRHMLDGAATELRERGILWRVIDAAADVTIRLGRVGTDESPGILYADLRHPERGLARLRIDGPLRTAAITAVLSRIARTLRSEDAQHGASSALRWLDQWDALSASMQHVEFCIGDVPVATLSPQMSTWHAMGSSDTPDVEHLVERMAREGFSLRLPERLVPPSDAGVPLKPLLWQMALIAGASGRMRALGARNVLRLKGWPYLAAGGPKAFGDLIRDLRAADVTPAAMDASGTAPPDERDGFLNACYACGFLQVQPSAGAAPHAAHAGHRNVGSLASDRAIAARNAPGKVRRVLSSIRRSLGMTAG